MQGLLRRNIENIIKEDRTIFPATAILGPRQCGKSTLAKMLGNELENFIYLDLERASDLKKLEDPELFFDVNKNKNICLDEIQSRPELFLHLRSIIDEDRRNGRLLLLGSASRDLLRQGSETLAGRISFVELTPFLINEVTQIPDFSIYDLWFRGGFPDSYLAQNDNASNRWRENFIRTFIERDIPQLGITIPALRIKRFLQMLAHSQGQILNKSKLGESLGVSYQTITNYIDLLEQTFIIKTLPPYAANLKKRIVKSPKIYIRDTGLLHSLLGIEDFTELMGHPVFGSSWETLALENILTTMPKWEASFYRTASGSEIDLILTRGTKKIALEFKSSKSPKLTKGFWKSLEDLEIEEAWIICPINEKYPIKKNIYISSIEEFISEFSASQS